MELLNLMGLGALPWQSLLDSAEAANIVAYSAAKKVGGVARDPSSRARTLADNLTKVGPQFTAADYMAAAEPQRAAAKAWGFVRGAATTAHAQWAAVPSMAAQLGDAITAINDAQSWASGFLAYAEQLDRAAKLSAAKASTGANVGPGEFSCPNGYVASNGSCVKAGSVTPTGPGPTTTDPMEQNCLNVGGTWDPLTGSCLAHSGDAGGDPFPVAKKFPTALVVGGLAAVGLLAWFMLRKPRGLSGYGRDYYGDDDDRAPSFTPGLGHGGYLDARGGHSMWALSPITGKRYSAGYHWHRPSGWRRR